MPARRIKVWRASGGGWYVTAPAAPGSPYTEMHISFPTWLTAYATAERLAEQIRVKARRRDEHQRRRAWLHVDYASGVTQGPL